MDRWSSNLALHHLAAIGKLENAIAEGSTLCTDTPSEEAIVFACYSSNVRLATHLASIVAIVLSTALKLASTHLQSLRKNHP